MVTLPYHEDRMHDGMTAGWQRILDRHHANLVGDLTAQLEAEVGTSVTQALIAERERAAADTAHALAEAQTQAEAALEGAVLEERKRASDESRRRLAESLNQTLRRIRQTTAEHETLQLLLEDSTPWAQRAVVLLIENNQARIATWRGAILRLEQENSEECQRAHSSMPYCYSLRERGAC